MSPPSDSGDRGELADRDLHLMWPVPADGCIWMEAGILAYKICDRGFRCETCPLDAAMRGPLSAAITGSGESLIENRRSAGDTLGSLPPGSFPADRRYHPAHTWAQDRGAHRIRIGIDALAARLAERTTGVVLPVQGHHLEQDKVGSWLIDEEGALALAMPMSGIVAALNGELQQRARLVVEEPYRSGWLLEIECADPAGALARLSSAPEMEARAAADLSALRDQALSLVPAREPLGPTLADGGSLRPDLAAILGPTAFRHLVQRLLEGSMSARRDPA